MRAMFARLLMLFALALGCYFWWLWKHTPDLNQRRKLILNLMLWGMLIAVALLAATGRIHWLGAVFAAALLGLKQVGLLLLRFFPVLAQIYRGKQQGQPSSAPPPSDKMSIAEACRILEVKADASVEEIKAAHRRQMSRQHPDHGGNAYFAAKLNEARDVLMAHRKQQGQG